MSDPIALVPLPRSAVWSSETWESDDPWSALTVGVNDDLPRSEYTLTISPAGASLTAGSEAALADGRNTFAQIVAGAEGPLPCVTISDAPRYAWRGLMIDVSRHFLAIPDLETMIDAMALHKLNVLHLHLTDDQGWRVEIKGYPRLTEVGGFRAQSLVGQMQGTDPADYRFDGERHGGFYTQDQLRDLVEYARRRGVMIVPEVDLPGHMQAAVAAYPELGNFPETTGRSIGVREVWGISDHVLGVSDAVFTFLRDVLEQVADIFPAPYVHIGGDECPRVEWERSTEARERMNEWGLSRVSEIQGRFTQFAADVLRAKGKRAIGWDEVLESHLPDDMIVMNWRKPSGIEEATSRGFPTVVATESVLYFDHAQAKGHDEPLAIGTAVTTLEDVYTSELLPRDLDEHQQSLILGIQAQLWTEYITSAEHLQYMAFPRLCAVAERAWGSPEQSFDEFDERLRSHLGRLDALGIAYRALD
ncbi:family 20 glycosylhydrolase [Brachybacterium huguangmaarense]|uniref:beta-N-acetylhexosaminidase n=1 Tax=Brachybacterium huguangmaarense TaxID=1652028 RepID=A0ABY6G4B8_9MICO|nr:family 20 glycosylhydrolase [Brachybacterium huguangmaarense]UYG17952.1 family 20 glycosylhydrolase [Brachybacterium huguangmaarense]